MFFGCGLELVIIELADGEAHHFARGFESEAFLVGTEFPDKGDRQVKREG
jgi:hypothetical protein